MLALESWESPLAPAWADSGQELSYVAWRDSGAPLDLDLGDLNRSVWRYALELIELNDPFSTFKRLDAFRSRIESAGGDASAVRRLASDALLLAGHFARAREYESKPGVGAAARAWADRDLTLARWLGFRISGEHLVALAGPKVTAFGKANFDLVVEQLEVQIRVYEAHHNVDVLAQWATDCQTHKFQLYAGGAWLRDHSTLYLSAHRPAMNWATERLRGAENAVREDQNLPKVGEGWLEETRLFYALQSRFAGEPVLQHASPEWLGRQHLDVFFPERRVAVEYHGQQHDQPVKFCGGEAAFAETVTRDRKKAAKCRANGVTLFVVRSGFNFDALVEEISTNSDCACAPSG